jgi:hypothetical protein
MDLMPCATFSCVEFGDDSVGRAAYICSQHRAPVTISKPTEPGGGYGITTYGYSDQWDGPWVACRKVWDTWQRSETARQLRAAEAEERQQIEFVNTVAGTLP